MKFTELPFEFREHMKELLGEEYEAYAKSFEEKRIYGLRINTGKAKPKDMENRLPFAMKPVPWTENGYYYEEDDKPSKDPFYYAGLYYLQEPSAMGPAAHLPVKPGDKVLDICAAPGGKSTELGAKLKGRGLLFSNDISNSRAKALLKNLELFGIPNICVTSETPEKLAGFLPEFFDAILIDAPCSGEGMFRKDDGMVKDWLEKGPAFYAPIQRQIVGEAVSMLSPGGYLLYSTCTFAKEEDEDVIQDLLAAHPELELVKIPLWEGAAGGFGLEGCIRLFPHKIKGEGHFMALMRKKSGRDGAAEKRESEENTEAAGKSQKVKSEKMRKNDKLSWEAESFLASIHSPVLKRGFIRVMNDNVYLLPDEFPEHAKFRYLRTGLLLGTLKKNRFEPSQALAMALKKEEFPVTLSLSRDDERIIRYLKGETIVLRDEEQGKKGWCLICAEEFPLGWGKIAGGSVKNKYYPGWRWQ